MGGEREKTGARRPRGPNAAAKREICERVAEGETLTRLCLDPRLPTKAAVLRALGRDAAFRRAYARARRLQAEHWAEEILEIVDAGAGEPDAEGRPPAEKDLLARAKLRVDARKWLLARLGCVPLGAEGVEEEDEEREEGDEALFAADDLTEAERDTLRGLLQRRLARQEVEEEAAEGED